MRRALFMFDCNKHPREILDPRLARGADGGALLFSARWSACPPTDRQFPAGG